jgi:hypothetical protein
MVLSTGLAGMFWNFLTIGSVVNFTKQTEIVVSRILIGISLGTHLPASIVALADQGY